MAKTSYRDLYISTSMSDLNQKSSYDFDKGKSIKAHITMMNKAFQAAETAYTDKDQERAYVLYMRYLDALTKVRNSKDYKLDATHYSTLIGTAKFKTAIERAEKLSEALKKRYEKLNDKKFLKKQEKNVEKNDEVVSNSMVSEKIPEEYKFPTEFLSCQELYQLLYKEKKVAILMDIRSVEDYDDSHIIHSSSINVPCSAISPGSVTSKIEKGIPLCHMKSWNNRDSVDLVVLIDWHSTVKRLQDKADPLRSLKDSIFKWEQVKELKHEPVVLEGGYADWIESFPQFTSNPQAQPPDIKPKTSNVNSLIDFDYADLKKSFNAPQQEKPEGVLEEFEKSTVNSFANGKMPKPSNPELDNNKRKADSVTSEPAIVTDSSQNVSGLYPKFDMNFNLPTVPQITKVSENEVQPPPKKQPAFDRSMKPKPPPTTVAAQPEPKVPSTPSEPNTSSLHKPPVTVDRSTKPTLSSVKQEVDNLPKILSNKTPNNQETEINELRLKIVKMQKDQEEKEKVVHEIEEKNKLNIEKQQLLSIQRQLERDAENLERRKTKAEKELATTMRHGKPGEDKIVLSSKNPADADSTENVEVSPQSSLTGSVAKSIQPVTTHSTPSSTKKTVIVNGDNKSPVNIVLNPTPAAKPNSDQVISKPKKRDLRTPRENDSQLPKSTVSASVASQPTSSNSTVNAILPVVHLPTKPNITNSLNAQIKTHEPSTDQKSSSTTPAVSALSPANSLNDKKAFAKPHITQPKTPGIPPPDYSTVSKKPTTSVSSQSNIPTSVIAKASDTSHSSVYKAPLKDEPGSQSFGLKRSFSSPNIAKMVQQEVETSKLPQIPSRQNKPSLHSLQEPVQIPSRDLKPSQTDDIDQYLASLNLSLRGVYGGEGRALCGLRNLGNSCYMNSVLQCMFNTTQLAEYILTNSYRNDINRKNVLGYSGKVAESFAVLLRAVWSGQYRYLVPSDIKRIAGGINSNFAGYSQEDSHEFLLLLLDGLHEDLNKIISFKYEEEPDNDHLNDVDAAKAAWAYHKKRNESIIVELFTGQFKATVRCLHCGKTSRKFDAFRFLTLSLPSRSASINDLVRDFSKEEKMTGSDRWKCPKCKMLREAVRTIRIWKLPPVLIIHLKRFVHTGRWRDKIHTSISFPSSNLDLNGSICGPNRRPNYHLYGVSHHHGAGLDSGHYVASIRSVLDNRWYKYDDTEVLPCSSPQDSSAFILFYCCYDRKVPRIASF